MALNTERANVVYEDWTENKSTGNYSMCVTYVDKFKNVNI